MPAYNAAFFIADAIKSIQAQSCSNWELIIVDDGSTDNTQDVIAGFDADKRIRLTVTANGGAARARNIAYGHSNGNYILFFDADDLLSPDFLETQLAKANENPDSLILADWGRFYNNQPDAIKIVPVAYNELSFTEWISEYWYHCNPMTNPGRALMSKTLVEKAGLWNEQLSLNDDLEFFTRVMLAAKNIAFNHEAVLYYRSGVAGLSSVKSENAFNSLFASIELSIKMVLDRYGSQDIIAKSCANVWQNFIYDVYPLCPELIKKAEAHMLHLPAPSIAYPSGGYTKFLLKFLDWKTVKKIKGTLN